MSYVLKLKTIISPVLTPAIQLRQIDLKSEMAFDFNVFQPPRAENETIPAWSPARPDAPVPEPLDILFPRAYFDCVRASPPSMTVMRHFNEKVARLRKHGLVPEWMPKQKFSPSDLPHLLALAFTQGPSGGLDLADVMSAVPKLLTKLRNAALHAGEVLDRTEGDPGRIKAILLIAAVSMIGLSNTRYSPFFALVHDPALNSHKSVVFLFNWISEGLGRQTINHEAVRAMHCEADVDNAVAARYMLYPQLDRVIEEANASWEAIAGEAFGLEESNEVGVGDVQSDEPIENCSPLPPIIATATVAPTKWKPPQVPEGVVLTGRAIRDIRRERRYAEDRLTDGLKLLGLYRSLRIGDISFDAYREAVRREHFEDAPCFADLGSLRAFNHDYSVAEAGKKYVLDRHLKWGKGNNVISAIRIYFAWDEDAKQVIVGSAPRHLPIRAGMYTRAASRRRRHYETWGRWRRTKDSDAVQRALVRDQEYEDWPRGQMVFDRAATSGKSL